MFFKSTPAVCQSSVRLCPETGAPTHDGGILIHPHHRMILGVTHAIATCFGDGGDSGSGNGGVTGTGGVSAIGRCVVVGCGGGSLPMALRSHAELVDVMEISAEVIATAISLFGLREGPGLRTLLGDALETLEPASTAAGFYDVIIVDVDAG